MLAIFAEPFVLGLLITHFFVLGLGSYLYYRAGIGNMSGLMMVPIYIAYIYGFLSYSFILSIPFLVIWFFGGRFWGNIFYEST